MTTTPPKLDEQTARECARLVCPGCADASDTHIPTTRERGHEHRYEHRYGERDRARLICFASPIWAALAARGVTP